MAEALAVVGVVASIVQLVQSTGHIIRLFKEYQEVVGELPKSLRHVNAELPLLSDTLQRSKALIENGAIDDTDTLKPVIDGCQCQIESLGTLLEKLIPLSDSKREKTMKGFSSIYYEGEVKRTTTNIRQYIQTLTYYHAADSAIKLVKDKGQEKLSAICQWLWNSTPDPSSNYGSALKLRLKHTGLWFLEGQKYAYWKAEPTSYIWLYGMPGCGKTILSSSIIEQLVSHVGNDPCRAVVYFYFDFKALATVEQMLKSILAQLAQRCLKLPIGLDSLYSNCGDGLQQPSLQLIKSALQKTLSAFVDVYMVLDALDESENRSQLMETIREISEWGEESLHLLLTSRKERDIEDTLESLIPRDYFISLRTDVVDNDIRTYVTYRLSVDKTLRKWYSDQTMREEISSALMKKSMGMFRWVVCQLDDLGKCLTRSMIKKTLNALPQTLDETYERILCGIDPKFSEFTRRILQWLTFSYRDLTPREAAHIIAIDVDNSTFDPDDILEDPIDVLLLCPSLATINYWATGYPKSVVLAHYSVKEFLVSKRILTGMASKFCFDEEQAHGFIASCCLIYLLHSPNGADEGNSFADLRLHRYARNNCWEHIRNAGKFASKANELVWQLFSCHETFSLVIGYPYGVKVDQHQIQYRLFFACQNDLDEVARRLIESGADVNGELCRNLGILSEAVGLNRVKVVDTLLSLGVDVNAVSKSRESWRATALMTACDDSNKMMVQKLLQAGADANFQNEAGETALSQAEINNKRTIMEILLKHGAHASSKI